MKLRLKILFFFLIISIVSTGRILPQDVFFRVKIKNVDGREQIVYRLKKGDVLYIDNYPLIPFLYRGGNPVVWNVDSEGRIIINRRIAGFILNENNLELINENREAEFFIWPNKNSLPGKVLQYIAENNIRKIFFSMQGYNGPEEDVRNLSILSDKLVFLSLRDSRISKIGKNIGLTYLNGIDLYNCSLTEDEILRLIGDNQLVRLNLGKTCITGKGLLELTKLANLKYLDLSSTSLGDRALELLKFFRNLEELDVSNTKISDEFLDTMRNSITLQEINLGYTKITDEGISDLKDLAFIKKMNLSGLEFGDNPTGLADLANMPRLQIIFLKNAVINKKVIDYISKCQLLRVLDITSTGIKDSDLISLGDMRLLEELYCGENELTCEAVKHIKNIQNLKVLDLTATNIGGGLKQQYFNSMDNLEVLYVGGTLFDDTGLAYIKDLPSLIEVDLSNTKVSAKSIPFILKMPALRKIYLTGSKFTPDDIKSLKRQSPLLEVYYEE